MIRTPDAVRLYNMDLTHFPLLAILPSLIYTCFLSLITANDAMKYGTSNEPTALQAYRNLMPAHLVEERTFAVLREDHVHGWLGASPDGIITTSGIYRENVPGEGELLCVCPALHAGMRRERTQCMQSLVVHRMPTFEITL